MSVLCQKLQRFTKILCIARENPLQNLLGSPLAHAPLCQQVTSKSHFCNFACKQTHKQAINGPYQNWPKNTYRSTSIYKSRRGGKLNNKMASLLLSYYTIE